MSQTSRQRFKNPKEHTDPVRVPKTGKEKWPQRFEALTPEQQRSHLDHRRKREQGDAPASNGARPSAKELERVVEHLANAVRALEQKLADALDALDAQTSGELEQRLYTRLEGRVVELLTRLSPELAAAKPTAAAVLAPEEKGAATAEGRKLEPDKKDEKKPKGKGE